MKVRIPDTLRDKHVYIIGTPGMGKSTLLHAMCRQDIVAGRGLCLIDPSGDLVNQLIHWIPKDRVEDTIVLDTSHPVPIDFLSYQGDREREILTDDIIKIFDAPNAPRMKGILHKLIPTLLEVNENPATPKHARATFLDIYRFLIEKKRREELLRYTSEDRRTYWAENFPRYDAIEPIAHRMAPFTESKTLSAIFGSPDAKLNVWDAMQSGKILLVSLDVNDSDRIFGTIFVSKIQQAAFRRRTLPKPERRPFCLYVDEFQNFQTSAFDVILTQGRKFQLWLTVCNQNLSQLDEKIRAAIDGVSTFVIMRISEHDAPHFKTVLGADRDGNRIFERLPNLPEHSAYYVVNRENLGLHRLPPPAPYHKASYAEIIRKRTVEKYACEAEMPVLQLKDDDIQPSTGPTKRIPSHGGKAKGHKAPG